VSDIDDTLREELSALLDGALPEERAGELRRRLESDAALRKEYEELRRTVAAVRALPRPSAPDELRARLERKLMAPPAAGIRRLRFRLAVAAVVTVAVGAGVLALRPSGPDPSSAHREARQDQDLPPVREVARTEQFEPPPGRTESLRKASRFAEAEAPKTPSELDEVRRAPPSGARAPEAPAAEMEEDEGKDDRPAARARAEGGKKTEDKVRDEGMARGGRRGDKEKGAAVPVTFADLLRSAGRARVAPETRMPYLFQLTELSARKVETHLNEVNATWGAAYRVATTLPPSANLTVTNLDEAKQVFTVLHKFPGTAGRGLAAALVVQGSGGKAPLLTAEVEVTPAQWKSVGTWLQLMNVAEPKRGVITADSGPRSKAKKRARPDPDRDEEKSLGEPADRDAKRKVKIYISYPQARAPAAKAGEK
jgi:hypothetical protein